MADTEGLGVAGTGVAFEVLAGVSGLALGVDGAGDAGLAEVSSKETDDLLAFFSVLGVTDCAAGSVFSTSGLKIADDILFCFGCKGSKAAALYERAGRMPVGADDDRRPTSR